MKAKSKNAPRIMLSDSDDDVLDTNTSSGKLHLPISSAMKSAVSSKKPRSTLSRPAKKDNSYGVDDDQCLKCPEASLSITITKYTGDVDNKYLDILSAFMHSTVAVTRGAVALEVGPRAHKLHFQMILIIRYPTAKVFISALAKHIKGLFPDNGKCKY